MKRFRSVLVATDFSEGAERALDQAVALASAIGASLTLVHACDEPAALGLLPTLSLLPGDLEERIADAARDELEASAARRRTSGVPIATVLRRGTPWEKINNVAAEVGAELIVVGKHGQRAAARVSLGSTSERLIRTATRPVLVVDRPPDDD